MAGKRKRTFKNIKRKFPKKMQKKLVMLFIVVVLVFGGLIGRIQYINVTRGERYRRIVLAQQQHSSRIIPFRRGDITDRNGTTIATSERVYNVILDAQAMLSVEEAVEGSMESTIEVVYSSFEIDGNIIRERVEHYPDSRYHVLHRGVSHRRAQEFERLSAESDARIAGIWLEEDYVRRYPYDSLASHLIGFTVDGNVGSVGLEASANSLLNGTDGREYGYHDVDMIVERTVREAVDGHTVVTTIDVNLQQIVERHILEFNRRYRNNARPGLGSLQTSVVIMNPHSGEILAMASYPSFDLNNPRDLSAFYSQEQLYAMSDEERISSLNQLWNNFSVSATFEPGSTIKPFTVAAALETGSINVNETYVCGGIVTVGEWDIRCHLRVGHGALTLEQAVANSCNVAMMRIAASMGRDEFARYQRIFRFGQYTGINLPGEASTAGLLFEAHEMGSTDLATNSFGQNFNATMIQLISAYSSLINGGHYYQPHVIRQIRNENGSVIDNRDPVLLKRTISEETSRIMREHTRAGVTDGTGEPAAVGGYAVAGKTGTAEKLPRGQGRYLLSFIGHAPYDRPEVAFLVIIDEPNVVDQVSSRHVSELTSRIMAEAFPYLNITKAVESSTP